MMRLLRLWQQNFGWLKIDSALAGVNQVVRNQIVHPIDQAIETTNFFIRDEAIQANMRETHAAALEISGEDSVLFTVPVMEVFERYNIVHKPRLVEHLQQFVAARDAGRVLHVRDEEQFARRMLRRFAREEDEEEDLPHRRRASI
jgi:acid stress-induced BolA-like protein IbaG/YrbA